MNEDQSWFVERLEKLKQGIENGDINIDDIISDEFMIQYRKIQLDEAV